MSFKEVTELRKSGHLTQAYNMALSDLKQMPNDSWSCSALFWVLYDISKQLVEQQRFDNIHNFLQQFNWVFERLRAMGRADEIVLKSINTSQLSGTILILLPPFITPIFIVEYFE
jgi:hypothetical protein